MISYQYDKLYIIDREHFNVSISPIAIKVGTITLRMSSSAILTFD
ncbi:TPA: hypothetical protein ACGZ9C_002780 [Elizabethkingia anophelis]